MPERHYAGTDLRGRPPFTPFARAAADFAVDTALPARRAAALAVVMPRYSGIISATEKSTSSSGHAIVAPRSSTLTAITASPAARTRPAVKLLMRESGNATLVPPTSRMCNASVPASRETDAVLARSSFIRGISSKNEQFLATFVYDAKRATNVGVAHVARERFVRAVAAQVNANFGAAAKDMHVRGLVVVRVDTDREPFDHDARHMFTITQRVWFYKPSGAALSVSTALAGPDTFRAIYLLGPLDLRAPGAACSRPDDPAYLRLGRDPPGRVAAALVAGSHDGSYRQRKPTLRCATDEAGLNAPTDASVDSSASRRRAPTELHVRAVDDDRGNGWVVV